MQMHSSQKFNELETVAQMVYLAIKNASTNWLQGENMIV